MHFPIPNIPPHHAPEPSALVRTVTREDVQWSRPIFKAPPLDLQLPVFDAKSFAEDLRRIGLVYR